MKERLKEILKTSMVGIIANVFLVIFKAAIGIISGSIAIILDAVNNLTDAISSIITIAGVYFANKDPDKKHPFGYGRIEYLSTLAIAGIILYAGITACIESIKSIFAPTIPEYSMVMLLILVVAVAVKVFLGLYFSKKGKETNSDSLQASGKDALFDALISAVTVITALLFMKTGLSLEAYLGVIIALIIIKAGYEILAETVSKILGEGASVDLVKQVKKAIAQHEGVRGAYDLIFHNYGQDRYMASVHIEVPEEMPAGEMDVLVREITEDIFEQFGIYLTAIGIYAYNSANQEIVQLRDKVAEIATTHEHVHQVHGFYADLQKKKIRFDMVISFDAPSREKLYAQVMEELQKAFPEYEISAGMDADFNEIS